MANGDGEEEKDREEAEAPGGFSEARAEAHLAEESDSRSERSRMSDPGSGVADDALGEKGRQDGTWAESRAEDEEQKQEWSAKADGLQGTSDGDGDQNEDGEDTWC